MRIVRTLPADLPVAICIVLHVPATGRSLLGPILNRQTDFDVRVASDGETLLPGRAYVAPPDRHLTVSAACGRRWTRCCDRWRRPTAPTPWP